jgi:hypothetical protein
MTSREHSECCVTQRCPIVGHESRKNEKPRNVKNGYYPANYPN